MPRRSIAAPLRFGKRRRDPRASLRSINHAVSCGGPYPLARLVDTTRVVDDEPLTSPSPAFQAGDHGSCFEAAGGSLSPFDEGRAEDPLPLVGGMSHIGQCPPQQAPSVFLRKRMRHICPPPRRHELGLFAKSFQLPSVPLEASPEFPQGIPVRDDGVRVVQPRKAVGEAEETQSELLLAC